MPFRSEGSVGVSIADRQSGGTVISQWYLDQEREASEAYVQAFLLEIADRYDEGATDKLGTVTAVELIEVEEGEPAPRFALVTVDGDTDSTAVDLLGLVPQVGDRVGVTFWPSGRVYAWAKQN